MNDHAPGWPDPTRRVRRGASPTGKALDFMPGVTADQAGHVAGSFAKAPPLHRPDAGEGLFSLAGVPYGVAARGALRLRKQRNRVLDRLLERMEAL